MNIYHLQGVIHPRRAQIQNHFFEAKVTHASSGKTATIRARILMNELSVWVETPDEWDIFDLRNAVRYLIQTELALVGFLLGLFYTVEIVRVIYEALKIDVVYSLAIPCIANREKELSFQVALAQLTQLCVGENGLYIQRCMNDLLLAMQQPEDTAFFCYRAIEGLKNHAMEGQAKAPKNKSVQWEYFRNAAGCTREEINFIKTEADRLRHSADLLVKSEDRAVLFTQTWNIVEAYIKSLSKQ
jgi:hypothetical protein